MNTLRVCAMLGLGLSIALGSGCSSNSSSAKKDAAPLDTRPDTTPAQPCVVGGVTIQPGRSAVVNCVTWTCVSGTYVNGSGTACIGDAGPTPDVAPTPDAPTNRDTAQPSDTRPVEAGALIDVGGKDTQPGEAGPVKDVGGNKDTFVPDVFIPQDTAPPQPDVFVPADTAPPTPDLPVAFEDTAPASFCIYGGLGYVPGGGVSFDCFSCKKCECASTSGGPLIVVTADNCIAVDAQ